MLVSSDALRHARDFLTAGGGVVAPLSLSEEELNPGDQDDLSVQAHAMEATTQCYPVHYDFPNESACSEFSYFEDGRQRTVHIGYIPATIGDNLALVPVHFFVVAAAIVKREDKDLSVWETAEVEAGVLVQKSLVPDQAVLRRYEEAGLLVIDTEAIGTDYYMLRRKALQEAKKRRLAAEDRLIGRWRGSREASEGFLVVDGTLMNFRNERNVERCVGVSKSFGSRYFDVTTHNRVLQMDQFERSWMFRFHSNEKGDDSKYGSRERISWYLRLRREPGKDPEFGLIRVEISPQHEDQASDLVNRFSRSLLSDRLPTSYPAPRWDNHLYPITACENYLASIMPSIETIRAVMKG